MALPFDDTPKSGANILVHADTNALADMFITWYDGDVPNIPSFVEDCIQKVGFSLRSKNIMRTAAYLAAEENDNPFHGNTHFLMVFSVAFMLGYDAYQDSRITEVEFRNLLTAALIHDYKHDGTNNAGIPFRLERIAFESAASKLRDAGADSQDLALIEALIFATDVSKDFSDPSAISPADSLKRYIETNDARQSLIDSKLDILIKRNAVDLAMMLHDSDVGIAHLRTDTSHRNGQVLAIERGQAYDPKNQIFFMDQICHGRCFSQSGIKIIGPCLTAVRADFEKLRTNPALPHYTA